MKYEPGSFCILENKTTVLNFPKPENNDPILERFKILTDELDQLLEEYDSEHLLHSYMGLKKAMALYVFFATEEYDFE